MTQQSEEELLRGAFRKSGAVATDNSGERYRRRSRLARWGVRITFVMLGSMISIALASEPRIMAQIERGMGVWKQAVASDAPTLSHPGGTSDNMMTDDERAEARGAIGALFSRDTPEPSGSKGFFASFSGAGGARDVSNGAKPVVTAMPTSKIPVRRAASITQ